MPDLPHLSKEALGYQLHTNRELGMMLRGEKPLALFSDWPSRFPDVVSRYLRMFDRHVSARRFVKREYLESCRDSRWLHVVLYALPAEEWRIDRMIELRFQLSSWTPQLERQEGRLLGYSEEQNDMWMARRPA
jgi:hypothetical protein